MKKLFIYLLLLLTTFSCIDETECDIDIPKGRTILVYLAGDSDDLSDEVHLMQAELMAGWNPKSGGSLVIFADGRSKTPLLIKIEERDNKIVADTLRRYDNDNSASPALLSQVIADMQVVAPGESYGMILFSHASGWLPAEVYDNPSTWRDPADAYSHIAPRSIIIDEGREMELADFATAIPNKMFDFMAFDMCFMSSVETAYALRNKTDYLLAAAPEVLKPGFTYIYNTYLNLLYKPKANLEGFGQAFFNYFNSLSGKHASAAISVVRTSEMDALAELTRQIAPDLEQDQSIIDQVQYYDGTFKRDEKGYPRLFFDFRDYISKIATPQQLSQMDDLLSKTVIFKVHTREFLNIIIDKHSGLSVYIPQASVPKLNKAYKKTDWWKAIN